VVTLLVNLTNSYEKQEIMPELIELAKFAKHHIPQEHELDDQDFIDKRIWVGANVVKRFCVVNDANFSFGVLRQRILAIRFPWLVQDCTV
jgi:hypothetical protein